MMGKITHLPMPLNDDELQALVDAADEEERQELTNLCKDLWDSAVCFIRQCNRMHVHMALNGEEDTNTFHALTAARFSTEVAVNAVCNRYPSECDGLQIDTDTLY